MKKLLITSDHHIAAKYPYSTSVNPFTDKFYLNAINALTQVASFAYENECGILDAGDMFDSEIIGTPELYGVMKFFNKLNKHNVSAMVNLGNHEIAFEEGIPPVIQLIAMRYGTIHTADYRKPWTEFMWQGLHVYLMPYQKEAVFNERLRLLLESHIEQPACLCIHQNIKGIQIGDSFMKEGLTVEEICNLVKKKFKFIICGHIHHKKIIDKFGIPIILPGSTIAMDFNDDRNDKGFYVLEFNKDYSIKNIQFQAIENQIRFKTFEFSEDKKKDLNFENTVCRFDVNIEDQQEFSEYSNSLSKAGVVAVQPRWHKVKPLPDIDEYVRPMELNMDDWLAKYLDRKGYHAEEIKSAIELNEKLFGAKEKK